MLAARRGHLDVVNLLLEHGARVREGYPYDAHYEACRGGHLAVVERLAQDGALQDGQNNSVLLAHASRSGSLDVLKALLWAGAINSEAVISVAQDTAAHSEEPEFVSLLQVSNWPSTTQQPRSMLVG
jgi:ankyrin repeat protein